MSSGNSPISVLYSELVIRHNREPIGFGPMIDASHRGMAENRSCGDEIRAALLIDNDQVIRQAGFEGDGCAICIAAASILSGLLPGQSTSDAQALLHRASVLVDTGDGTDTTLGELAAFIELKHAPARRKCAQLSIDAFRQGLSATPP